MRYRKPKSGKRGAILFVAVGAIVILSILAMGTASSVLQELKLARLITASTTCPDIAVSVLEAMQIVWSNDPTPMNITLYDLRSRNIPFVDKIAQASFVDEQSKIHIGQAPANILLRLPGLSGQTELVNKVAAADILVKEDLLLVDGITQEIYDELKSLVTVYGPGSVNVNTATAETLSFLGMDSDLADMIQQFRAGPDGQGGTEDDKCFFNTLEIVSQLEPLGLTEPQRTLLQSLTSSGILTTTSASIAYEIVIRKNGLSEPDKVRPWRTIRFVFSGGEIVSWREE